MSSVGVIGTVIAKISPALMKAESKRWAKGEVKAMQKMEKKALRQVDTVMKKFEKDRDKKGLKKLKQVIGVFIHLTMMGYDVRKLGTKLEQGISKADAPDQKVMNDEIERAFSKVFKKENVVISKSPIQTKSTNAASLPGAVPGGYGYIAPPVMKSTGIDIAATASSVQKVIQTKAAEKGETTIVEALKSVVKTGQAPKIMVNGIGVPASGGIAGGGGIDYTKGTELINGTQMDKIKEILTKAFEYAKKYWYVSVPLLVFIAYKLYKRFSK